MAKVKKMAMGGMGGMGVPYITRGNSAPSMLSDPRSGRFNTFGMAKKVPFNTAGNSAPSMIFDPRAGRFNTLGMAKGGSASARADGCCVKGKTKGRMV